MATSTLIQYLDKSQTTATGSTTPVGARASDRSQTETFLAETTITAGQWVQFDTAQSGASKVLVVKTAVPGPGVAAINALVVGVALDSVVGTATAPQPVRVVVSGYVETANITTGTAVGEPLGLTSGATAGKCDALAAAITNGASPCGVALSVAAANVGSAWVYKQF